MDNIIKPEILKISEEKNSAVFEIKPCYPGYGLTLGNALRRVLLSSLSGAAITSIKIKGISHEFTTIPHVMEDAVEIMLNLKQVRIKVDSTDEVITAELKVSGEKEIKAGDIVVSNGAEIINKDLHIATMADKKASVEMSFVIEKGIGYRHVDKSQIESMPVGSIALDAMFSPVVKANYEIEDMRVGQMTNYNKIKMQIETDGTMEPEQALLKSSVILVGQFKSLIGESFAEEASAANAENENKDQAKTEEDEYAEAPESLKVSELGLSKRTVAILEENKIKTVNKLANKSKKVISELSGIGAKGLAEIDKALNELGLSLKD